MIMRRLTLLLTLLWTGTLVAQPSEPDWSRLEDETLRHFRALLQFDTSDPPGRELPAAEYLKRVLEDEGIPVEMFALDAERPNVVARLKGSGAKEPLLIMAHTDVVNVDPAKWTFPPFSATLDGGYVYARGTVDDKDNVVASLMVMLELKRLDVALERDVIFLAESGEEGNTRYGIEFIGEQPLAEDSGRVLPRRRRACGPVSGERSSTLRSRRSKRFLMRSSSPRPASPAMARFPCRRTRLCIWRRRSPRLPIGGRRSDSMETTSTYFERLASISPPDAAERYLNVLDPDKMAESDAYFLEHEPRHASMLRSSLSPNIFTAGYRINIIPSEAKATVDWRALPDEDIPAFLDEIRKKRQDSVAFFPVTSVIWRASTVSIGKDGGLSLLGNHRPRT